MPVLVAPQPAKATTAEDLALANELRPLLLHLARHLRRLVEGTALTGGQVEIQAAAEWPAIAGGSTSWSPPREHGSCERRATAAPPGSPSSCSGLPPISWPRWRPPSDRSPRSWRAASPDERDQRLSSDLPQPPAPPQLPALLRWAGGLDLRNLGAEHRSGMADRRADPLPDRLPPRAGRARGLPVPAIHRLWAAGRTARGPLRQAHHHHRHPNDPDVDRRRPGPPVVDRAGDGVGGLSPGCSGRGGAGRRHAGPAGLRLRDGGPEGAAQRRIAERLALQPGAGSGARCGRGP